MSEAMAIESIAEEYAKFLGYLTETRVPFKLQKGHSDIDVLGFNPRNKKSLLVECKASGSPDQYCSFNTANRKNWLRDQFKEIINKKWGYFKKSQTNLNYHRIRVGLGTWKALGIVSGSEKDGFFIVDSFKNIVKEELRRVLRGERKGPDREIRLARRAIIRLPC